MSLQTIITTILIVLILAWVNYYAKKKGKQADVLANGKKVLKSHIIYGIISYFLILLVIFFIGLGFYFNWDLGTTDSLTEYIFPILFVLGIGYLAVYVSLYYYNHKLIFDSNEIVVFNTWGSSKSMNWIDIKDVEFNNMMQEISIYSKNGEKLKFSCILYGLDDFKAEFAKHHPFMIQRLYN